MLFLLLLFPAHTPSSFKPQQEFNIEKLTLLDAEKARVAREFERRDAAVEVKKKM